MTANGMGKAIEGHTHRQTDTHTHTHTQMPVNLPAAFGVTMMISSSWETILHGSLLFLPL
jgi:hypothetical protein